MLKRILLLVILMTSLNCYAENIQDQILFSWNLGYDEFSVEINEEKDFLQVIFLQEQVSLDLQILDDGGNCVYKEFLNSSVNTEYIVPIGDLYPGNYRLILVNEIGEKVCGEFVK